MNDLLRWLRPEVAGQSCTKNIEYGNDYAVLEYACNGFWIDRVENERGDWDVISIPEASSMSFPGAPALPTETVFIALPPGNFSEVSVEVLSVSFESVEGQFRLLPSPLEKRKSDGTPILHYETNEEIYSSSQPFPADFAKLGAVKVMAGFRVASIVLFPVRYFPREARLEVLTKATIRMTYEEGPPLAFAPSHIFSTSFLRQIQGSGSVLFAGEKPPIAAVPELPTYFAVTSRSLESSLQPLLDHRKSEFDYQVLFVDDFSEGSDPLDVKIKKAIKERASLLPFNQPLRAILLGGDHSTIPSHTYQRQYEIGSESFLSDHFYSDLEDNYFPDVPVGRLPASTPDEMHQMVRKIIDYESMSGEWQKRMWNCGYKKGKYKDEFIMPVKQINALVRDRIELEWAIFNISIPQMLNKAKQNFFNAVNEGVAIVNYNGHGQHNAWQHSVSVNDLTQISPAEGLPIVICSACNNGMISASDCFASTWIIGGKSVGVIASSSFSHVWINGEFDSTIIRALTMEDLRLGDVLDWAKIECLKNNLNNPYDPNNNPLAVDNTRMYLLLGDPMLKVGAVFSHTGGA